jgi:hypothetical protein
MSVNLYVTLPREITGAAMVELVQADAATSPPRTSRPARGCRS